MSSVASPPPSNASAPADRARCATEGPRTDSRRGALISGPPPAEPAWRADCRRASEGDRRQTKPTFGCAAVASVLCCKSEPVSRGDRVTPRSARDSRQRLRHGRRCSAARARWCREATGSPRGQHATADSDFDTVAGSSGTGDTVNDVIHHNSLRPESNEFPVPAARRARRGGPPGRARPHHQEDIWSRDTVTTGRCESQGSFQPLAGEAARADRSR